MSGGPVTNVRSANVRLFERAVALNEANCDGGTISEGLLAFGCWLLVVGSVQASARPRTQMPVALVLYHPCGMSESRQRMYRPSYPYINYKPTA